ncbi:uncharacterized protein LOC109948594 [Prunus persica]|uniref:uncharacterized protein LOC109948594 n=1 Tax=Prunus persica TaxID=3760 RepID=UPI0009AB3BB9|nr:uncharacterized protein LOC109948594 [Prunus persica]
MLEEFKQDMMVKYEMTNLGLLHHFLGMGVIQTHTSIFLHQKKYATSLLSKFGRRECKLVSIPLVTTEKLSKDDGSGPANEEQYRKIVGSLLYLTATRHDIMYASSLFARFMHCPTNKHYGTAKRVLRLVPNMFDDDLDDASILHFQMSAETAYTLVGLGTTELVAFDWRAAIFEASNTNLLLMNFSLSTSIDGSGSELEKFSGENKDAALNLGSINIFD